MEYSPSDNAKIYDKPLTRRNIATFSPDSAIRELSTETLASRNTVEGDFKLAENFHNVNFFKIRYVHLINFLIEFYISLSELKGFFILEK